MPLGSGRDRPICLARLRQALTVDWLTVRVAAMFQVAFRRMAFAVVLRIGNCLNLSSSRGLSDRKTRPLHYHPAVRLAVGSRRNRKPRNS